MEIEEKTVTEPIQGKRHEKKPKKRRKSRVLRRLITYIVVLAILAAAAFAVWYFVFREEEGLAAILEETVQRNTIVSTVSGSGSARASGNSGVTLGAGSVVGDVFVNVGDIVFEGMPLYTATNPNADAAVEEAKKNISDQEKTIEEKRKAVEDANAALTKAQEDLEKVRSDYAELQGKGSELTLTAPFAGKITEAVDLTPGQMLSAGEKVGTLVNDRQMRLRLYFSYAYENDIFVGQDVDVSIPVLMLTLKGRVEDIHKVQYITPEGGIYFEVTVSFANPGTLTAGMDASASMRDAAGYDIYPYENGELEFSGTQPLTVKRAGSVSSVGSIRDYASVEAGDVLLVQSPDALNDEIKTFADTTLKDAEDAVTRAQAAIPAAEQEAANAEARLVELQEALEKAEMNVTNLDAVAPISGTVTSVAIVPGMELENDMTVITITDTSNMIVEITVDDRNIGFVTAGMEVTLSDYSGMTYTGIVTKIDMENFQAGQGMSTYPVTLTVENSSGALQQGRYLQYSFVTSKSEDCLTVPIQCVKSIVDNDGESHEVVFLKAESRPDNAIDFTPPENYYGSTPMYPTPEDGYWPVPVETGLHDRLNVEITSGLNEGDVIFNAFTITDAYSY